jgi:hypothetical protein
VAAEEVGREQDPFGRQPGALGVRPVQVRRVEEFELPIAEIGMSPVPTKAIRPARSAGSKSPFSIRRACGETSSVAPGARRSSSGRAPE